MKQEAMVEKLLTTFHLFRHKVFHDFKPDTGDAAMNRTQLDLEKGSLTPVIDSLIELGLVNRERNHHDRRKINLALTGRGEELLSLHRRQAHRHLLAKMESLSEEEVARFSEAFAVIYEITLKL